LGIAKRLPVIYKLEGAVLREFGSVRHSLQQGWVGRKIVMDPAPDVQEQNRVKFKRRTIVLAMATLTCDKHILFHL